MLIQYREPMIIQYREPMIIQYWESQITQYGELMIIQYWKPKKGDQKPKWTDLGPQGVPDLAFSAFD